MLDKNMCKRFKFFFPFQRFMHIFYLLLRLRNGFTDFNTPNGTKVKINLDLNAIKISNRCVLFYYY